MMGMRRRLFDDFVVQFDHRFPEHVQHGCATGRQVIVAPPPFPFSHSDFGSQPSVSLEALQEWVERAGTDVIAVSAEFGQDPLADDRVLRGVMHDVHLPEAQQDLSRQQFGIQGSHAKSPPRCYYDARKRLGDYIRSGGVMWKHGYVTTAPASVILIRLLVGAVFLSEGIQKFLFPDQLGAGRFLKIGLPSPEILGPFVGGFEILFGTLVLMGLLTRFAVIQLLAIMAVALTTTKWPILVNQGFWAMAHEARTDWSMTSAPRSTCSGSLNRCARR
jgi:putative oxidoreductase